MSVYVTSLYNIQVIPDLQLQKAGSCRSGRLAAKKGQLKLALPDSTASLSPPLQVKVLVPCASPAE